MTVQSGVRKPSARARIPVVDGLEVCRRLRANDRDLAILMLTGRASVPVEHRGNGRWRRRLPG